MSGTRNSSGSFGRHGLRPTVGQVDRVPLFVEHEVEGLLQIPHPLLLHGQLAVGDGVELHPLHQLLDPGLVQHLEQPLVLRHAQPGLIELQRRIVPGLGVLQQRLGLGQQRVYHRGLLPDQLGHLAAELGVLLVGLVAHRPGDDQRGPGLVDEDRVHLVDDGVRVLPLHPLIEREHHVVAQVIEAELVVGAVGDVGEVGGAALGRGRLGIVETGDRQARDTWNT